MSVGTSEAAAGELNPEGIADRTTVGVFFSQAARYGDRPLVHYKIGEAWKIPADLLVRPYKIERAA